MFGLTVRWSLTEAPSGALAALRLYVEDESFQRFAGLPGLRFKTWRAREDEWFEGQYVFASDEARAEFQAQFESVMNSGRVTELVGGPPDVVEPFEVVAAVRGPAGFRSAAPFEA